MGELAATSRVCQTFVAAHDGLARVEVRLTGRNRKDSGPFHFYLRTVPDADHDLVSLTHDAAAVNSNVYHVFRFRPMPGSAGQSYRFCLEAPEADLDSSIAAVGTVEDWYPQGQATFRDMWVEARGVQDLDFRLGYRLSLWERGVALSDRLVANKPLLCGVRSFYVLLGTIYLILLYGLLARSVPARDVAGDPP